MKTPIVKYTRGTSMSSSSSERETTSLAAASKLACCRKRAKVTRTAHMIPWCHLLYQASRVWQPKRRRYDVKRLDYERSKFEHWGNDRDKIIWDPANLESDRDRKDTNSSPGEINNNRHFIFSPRLTPISPFYPRMQVIIPPSTVELTWPLSRPRHRHWYCVHRILVN